MLSDVAIANGAEQCVSQCVQNDVGIGMAFELVRMRNFHATEPDVVAVRETMNVEARPGARLESNL